MGFWASLETFLEDYVLDHVGRIIALVVLGYGATVYVRVRFSVNALEAKSHIGQTFTGYKGGDFIMNESTHVWIATYGTTAGSGQIIGVEGGQFVIVGDIY